MVRDQDQEEAYLKSGQVQGKVKAVRVRNTYGLDIGQLGTMIIMSLYDLLSSVWLIITALAHVGNYKAPF